MCVRACIGGSCVRMSVVVCGVECVTSTECGASPRSSCYRTAVHKTSVAAQQPTTVLKLIYPMI